jgi:hypothetical protein
VLFPFSTLKPRKCGGGGVCISSLRVELWVRNQGGVGAGNKCGEGALNQVAVGSRGWGAPLGKDPRVI